MSGKAIRFNQTSLEGKELDYIQEAVARGHTSSGGPFTERVAELLNEWFEAREVILTTSCTDALEMAALLTEVAPGDEVIVPSFTFVSTALAFARMGADLVFADIEDRYLSLDPDDVESLITDRTRAIVTVHYAGIGGDIPRLVDLSTDRISLIEDNAHGLFGQGSGRKLGTFGRFSTLSFHETKNFTCGEGGALIINDEADVSRAHVLNDKGTNRKAFFEGQVDKYSWQDMGSSFGLSDLLAGYLLGQLEQRDRVLARRRHVFDTYMTGFEPLQEEHGIRVPLVPPDAVPAYHMFFLLMPTEHSRTAVLSGLRERGVNATFHYVPLHSSVGGQKFATRWRELPVTDSVSQRLIRLPFHNQLSDDDLDRVITLTTEAIREAA
jgi:dTDP-4-amino-4,6-dideoxygalactose transaminase